MSPSIPRERIDHARPSSSRAPHLEGLAVAIQQREIGYPDGGQHQALAAAKMQPDGLGNLQGSGKMNEAVVEVDGRAGIEALVLSLGEFGSIGNLVDGFGRCCTHAATVMDGRGANKPLPSGRDDAAFADAAAWLDDLRGT